MVNMPIQAGPIRFGRYRAVRLWAAALLLCAALGGPPAQAEELLYTLQIPENRPVTYGISFKIEHPGTLRLHAEWSGDRRVAFRVDAPHSYVAVGRCSGPSPQDLTIEIGPELVGQEEWKLTIIVLAARGSGEGLLNIFLPGPPEEVRPPTDPAPPPVAQPEPDPWMIARQWPADSPRDWRRFFGASERFRSMLESKSEPAAQDNCRWQNPMMRFLAESHDALVEDGAFPSDATQRVLAQIAEAISLVDELRSSKDPLLVGPPPDDPQRKEVWRAVRRDRIRSLEGQLDQVLELIHRGHAPELSEQEWPERLVTCLAACERHFEERLRLGEDKAINRDLVRSQWEHLRAAAEALQALADLESVRTGLS
jgi:hypothetical protein